LLVGVATAIGCLIASGTTQAAPATELACTLDKTRTFTPSLGTISGSGTYTFTTAGTVICSGISNGAPASLTGTVSVGNTFATPSANAACDALAATHRCADPDEQYGDGRYGCAAFSDPCEEIQGGDGLFGCGRTAWWWQEPAGELVGTAGSNTTAETRFLRWDSGGVTIAHLTNDDVTFLKLEGWIEGMTSASATVVGTGPGSSTEPCSRQPASLTISATRDAGAEIDGALWAVTPASNPGCSAGGTPAGCPTVRLVGADVIGG
jgi:hypothetical protein